MMSGLHSAQTTSSGVHQGSHAGPSLNTASPAVIPVFQIVILFVFSVMCMHWSVTETRYLWSTAPWNSPPL